MIIGTVSELLFVLSCYCQTYTGCILSQKNSVCGRYFRFMCELKLMLEQLLKSAFFLAQYGCF